MRKMLACGFVFIAAVACNERPSVVAPAPTNLGTDDNPILPMGEPAYSAVVLQDQAQHKPPSHTLSDSDRETIEKLAGTKGAAAADGEESASKGGKKGSASKLLGGLKKMLGGSDEEASDEEESGEESADADESEEGDEEKEEASPVDLSKVIRTEARDEVTAMPKNPDNRPNQGISRAKELATEDARKKLIAIALALPLDPSMTVGRAIGTSEGVLDTTLPGMKVVDMKWVDADTLHVEFDIALGEVGKALQDKYPDSDLKPLIAMSEGKFIAAVGRGVIPPNLRNANRSLPGERAKQAAEEGGAGI